jgi:hypothetical protein
MSVRRAITIVAFVLLLASCGGSSNSPSATSTSSASTSASTTEAPTDARAAAREVLHGMEDPLLSTVLTARDRAQASDAGDTEKAARLERSLNRKLKRVQGFGRDARERLINVLDTPEAKATTKAADAWTHWAFELRSHPPANNFKQAQHIADLATVAIRDYQAAYRAIGEQAPPAFRSR